MLFPPYILTRMGNRRFTALQLNTLGRFDEPLSVVLERQRTLLEYISKLQPSIASLQEVPTSAGALEGNANIPDSMMSQYPYYGVVSYAKASARGDLGCVLYDKRVFELVSEECFRFSANASQFAIVVVLRLRNYELTQSSASSTSGCVLLVAQHAKAGRTQENENIRIQHSQELLAFLKGATNIIYKSLVNEGKFIWMGDMNAGPTDYGNGWPCEWHQRVIQGTVGSEKSNEDSNSGGWVNTEIPLLSVMTIAHNGSEPPFTTYKSREGYGLIKQTIDYILVSKSSPALAVVGVTSPASVFVEGGSCLPPDGFPNSEWGSDHLPLVCEFEYRETVSHASHADRDC